MPRLLDCIVACRRSALSALLVASAACQKPAPPDASSAAGLPLAALNDNRFVAGRMENGARVVDLEIVRAAWTPRGPKGPRVAVAAFAEAGGVPSVPGPLIRAEVGTPIRMTVKNTLDEPITVGRAGREFVMIDSDSLVLEPGERRELVWTPQVAVSTVYLGVLSGRFLPPGPTTGVLIIDPKGQAAHPDERILHLASWGSPEEPGSLDQANSWKATVNGRSWPYTERFEFTVGDTVRWRVVNSSLVRHPMHLHGFYFDVTSAGDMHADTAYAPATRSPVVTHLMTNRSAMTLRWVPTTEGNWLFHCHLLRHMGASQRFVAEATAPPDDTSSMAMDDGMAGLITGITVRPAVTAATATAPIPPESAPSRRVDLWTGSTPKIWDDSARLGFVIQAGASAPAPDSTNVASSMIVLERDEPVEIMVHNRLETNLSVHWHGIELRSEYDGVGHWSGMPGMTRPPIPAGDSVRVHLQPPRAGTFIYHTHGEDGTQLAQGLYGALLVMPKGQSYDATRDRVFVMGAGGAQRDAEPAINGMRAPPPERVTPGQSYRLRFVQIAQDESKVVQLLHNGAPAQWRRIAKDGADLPQAMRVMAPATFRAEVGETFDYEWTPDSVGVYQLVVKTVEYPLDGDRGSTQTIAFAVGDVDADVLQAAHGGYDKILTNNEILRLFRIGSVVVPVLLGVASFFVIRWFVRRRRVRRGGATVV